MKRLIKNDNRRFVSFVILLVATLVTLAGILQSSLAQAVKKFRYPDYDKQGNLIFEVTGDEAEIESDGLIKIKNIKIVFYEAGKMIMWFTSPSCTFDRARRAAASTSTVYIARSDVVITVQLVSLFTHEVSIT
jgi:hypothetical protein